MPRQQYISAKLILNTIIALKDYKGSTKVQIKKHIFETTNVACTALNATKISKMVDTCYAKHKLEKGDSSHRYVIVKQKKAKKSKPKKPRQVASYVHICIYITNI